MPDRTEWYTRHYTDLFAPLLSLMRHGVAIDLARAAQMRAELLAECERIQADLSDIAGVHDCACGHRDSDHLEKAAPVVLTKTGKPKKRQPKPTYTCRFCYGADGVWCRDFTPLGQPLHAKKDLSSDRVTKFLYETLGFPKQRNRGEESPTGNEIAVRRLTIKAKKWLDEGHTRVPKDAARWKRDPTEAIRACQLILEHREKFKTAGFLDEAKIDEDGRLRCQYRFTTETGRLASRKNPYGTGANLQNIHRGVRSCFIPNDGCLFLEGDLSQAEKRVVDVLTHDPVLIENARSKPWEFDAHTHNAAIIFNVPVTAVTKEQRYLGKRAVHACVDASTEVLTPFGWIAVYDYPGGPIAQWDNGVVTFVNPTAWHVYEHDGPMMSFQGRALSQVVTKNHRMPYMTNGNVKVAEATKVPQEGRIPVAGIFMGYESLHTDEARLIAAIQADGNINGRRVRFKFRKVRKIKRIKTILQALKIPFTENIYKKDTVIACKPPSKTIRWLNAAKTFDSRLLNLDHDSAIALLDEVVHWDGSLKRGRREYCTAIFENAELIQTLAHLHGREALLRHKPGRSGFGTNDFWTVSFNRRKYARAGRPDEIYMKGQVYCPTVPSGFFLVRRDLKISVTGNSNYGMHGKRLSEALLLDGFTRTPDECQAMIDAYLNACSAIRTWQRAVRKRLMRDGQLVNSWGRVLSFKGERLNDDTYRRGYAFVPQSEIGDLMNQWGLVPMWRWLREGRMRSRINLQVHDALVISVTPDEAYDVACAMQGFLERPRTYEGVELVVPVEFKLGTRWGCGVCEGCRGKAKCRAIADFKRLPDRAAFNEVVRSLTRQHEKEAA